MKNNEYTYGLLWNVSGEPYQFTDKRRAINNYIRYMLNRLQGLFSYEGLPETIPQRNLELLLQVNGNATIADVNGSLYAFRGGLGGVPDPYYMPTISVVANPALKLSKTYTIDEDCIVIPNDAMYAGLMPLLRRYCTSLVENDITMNLADINMRLATIITAGDDKTKYAAEKYLKDLIDGKLGILGNNTFLESVGTQPYAASGQGNQVTQLIEYEQYLKASMLNELGIQMNWNSKRESINGEEAGMNNQSLLPLIYDMYQQRQLGVEKVNDMFGTSITVRFGYPWLDTVDDPVEDEQETETDVKEDEPDVEEQGVQAEDSIQEND